MIDDKDRPRFPLTKEEILIKKLRKKLDFYAIYSKKLEEKVKRLEEELAELREEK